MSTLGDQLGLQGMDLLTAPEHEVAHMLDCDHEATGVTADTTEPARRQTPGVAEVSDWPAILDLELSDLVLATPKR